MIFLPDQIRSEKGAVAIFVAVTLAVFIGIAAFAVDIGYTRVARTELQRAADAAALAATRQLGVLYEAMSYEAQQTYDAGGDEVLIKAAAVDVASKNRAAGTNIVIDSADIQIGTWDQDRDPHFLAGLSQPDAVHVTARRDGTTNGPITTFFARIFGINSVSVSAGAIAALTGQSVAAAGGLPFPVGINKSWMTTVPCDEDLTFHPSSADTCSGWHAYDGEDYKPTGSGERKMIEDITDGKYSSPETIAGQTYYDFSNGTLAAVFTHDVIQTLFNTMKVKNDGVLDRDNDSNTWTTGVPIFDDTGWVACNPNGPVKIVGFSTITITSVSGPPESTVYATVKCDNVEEGRGGGGNYGTKGSIPGLVQ